ncbi:hypothetical protein AR457_33530 [Streptomyces agglomeratus]|uniref:hypothetical protein n=1 Tax=Streptomyces agglomeratus TaxID=285458 RepID=UPI00085254BA|nr:hypothetical protein [Streptomyces agglomeratus]OEJ37289.1 hypothetical protein BGK70_03140 [Streptomyces agglomeratus]OEJ48330.1 hypothetical protein AR457_33530 [Streptomyces agglomeratus]OEJ57144.1 hypothetical protein BGM19_03225 [Streptomyces agglomeratus]
MRATSIHAVLAGALVFSASAVTAPAAYATETGVVIQKLSVNGGKPLVLGTSQTESVTLSVTASDDSGISSNMAFLQIDREVGDEYWSYHGRPTCTPVSATTSTCKLTVKLDAGWGVPRNALAGPWDVTVQLQAKDGDLYNNGGEPKHPVLRRGKLTVNASPEPVYKGKTLKVTGKLTRANWDKRTYAGYADKPVKLQFRKAGTSTYTTVKTAYTNSFGNLSTTVTASADGYWRWSFAGTSTTSTANATGDYVDVR